MSVKKEYDDNGNVTSSTYYDSEGNVECSWKHTYDGEGNMTSSTWYDSEGNVKERQHGMTVKVM